MGEVIDNEDVEVYEILGAEHAVFWRSVTAKGSLADLTNISERREVSAPAAKRDPCAQMSAVRQPDFTSAGSFGITSTLDQKCFIELGTP